MQTLPPRPDLRENHSTSPASPPEPPLPPHTAVIDGPLLRRLRHDSGLSIEDLAWQARVGQTTLGRLERADRPRCRLSTLIRLAHKLGHDPARIAVLVRFGKNDPPTIPQPGTSIDRPTPPAVSLAYPGQFRPSHNPARRSDWEKGATQRAGHVNHDTSQLTGPASRRSDVGAVRLTGRDVTGMVLCGEQYGAPYDLLARHLEVREDRLRAIVARWRAAGYADTGRLGPGPTWCWLTRSGLAAAGLRYSPGIPALARLAHLRAVLAVRLALEAGDAWQSAEAHWRSERRIRAAMAVRIPWGHVPDAEVSWPDVPASPYPGERWAIEAELTPKPLARTSAIMSGLLGRTAGYHPDAPKRDVPRYDRVVYLTAPPAASVTHRAVATLLPALAAKVTVRDLPDGALL